MGDLMRRERESSILGKNRAILKTLIMPGSHNAGSYSIPESSCCSKIGRTQNLTIREQLMSGVRFLDLRIAGGKGGGNSVYIYHGRLRGDPFEDILAEIRGFCLDYPKEFLVLEIVAEHDRPFSSEAKLHTLRLLRQHFGLTSEKNRLLAKVTSRNELITTPLEEVIQTIGRVFVTLKNIYEGFVINGMEYTNEHVEKQYGFFDAKRSIQNKWHNKTDAWALLRENLKEIHIVVFKAKRRRFFVNNQFFLTPKVSGFFQSGKSLAPIELANKELYQPPFEGGIPLLHAFFLEHYDEDWNMLSLDFVDRAPSLMNLWIGMNFGTLTIELALVGSGPDNRSSNAQDVTEIVKNRVIRKSCLFLHPKTDFETVDTSVPDPNLTIVYSIAGKLHSIVVPLSKDDPAYAPVIVLSEQNHILAGGAVLTVGEMEGNGTVDPETSGVLVTWQKTERKSFRFGYQGMEEQKKWG